MTEMAGVSNEINFESFLLTFTKKVHTSITLKEMKDAEAVQAYNVWRNVKKSGT